MKSAIVEPQAGGRTRPESERDYDSSRNRAAASRHGDFVRAGSTAEFLSTPSARVSSRSLASAVVMARRRA